MRLRANPKKVRIAVRRIPDAGWLATIEERNGTYRRRACGFSPYADIAIESALSRAVEQELDGLDLGCDWAYVHPWPSWEHLA